METNLSEALLAMDQLNRWVRTKSYNRPRRAIYWLKTNYAVRDAIMAGMMVNLRPVQAIVTCNKCDSHGIYIDWNGYPCGTCRHCNGTKKAKLKFAEVGIFTGTNQFTWHSPINYRSWLGWSFDDSEFIDVTGEWAPGKEGIELPVEAQARLLNIVESYWMKWIVKNNPYNTWEDEDGMGESSRTYHFKYALELPLPDVKECVLCGKPATMRSHSGRFPGIDVLFPTCSDELCHKQENFWERLKALPMPKLGPNLEAWAQTHALLFKDAVHHAKWDHQSRPFSETA